MAMPTYRLAPAGIGLSMIKLAAGRVFSMIAFAGGWLLFGARLVLEFIGYSTAPEDLVVARSRLDQAIILQFIELPWWAPLGVATIATFG